MKSPWYVTLVRTPTQDDFPTGFFPRKFHYRAEAQELVDEVARKGGEAKVVRTLTEGMVEKSRSVSGDRYRIKFLTQGPRAAQSVPGIVDRINEAIEIAEQYVRINPDSVAWVESDDGSVIIKVVK